MSSKYRVYDNTKAHFVTITIVEWIDLFTRLIHKNTMIESLDYCRKNKGLEIYAWCLMPSHLHMICRADENNQLRDIMRDLKTFTSKKLIENIKNEPESRREWLLAAFAKACEHLKRDQTYKVWQNGYHGEEIYSQTFLESKINYIHQNPVKDGIVCKAEDYLYSSARNYAELEAMLEIDIATITWKTI